MVEDETGLKDLGVRYLSKIFKDDGMTNIEAQLKVIRLFPSFLQHQEDLESFNRQISMEEVEHGGFTC